MYLAVSTTRPARKSPLNNETSYSDLFRTATSSENTTWNGTTKMNDKTEFTVPGFLLYIADAEFRHHTRIAKGGGGEAFLGDALVPRLQEFGSSIIVKIAAVNRQSMSLKMLQAFDQEVSVMHYLGRHKNIAGLLGWCEEPVNMFMRFYHLGAL